MLAFFQRGAILPILNDENATTRAVLWQLYKIVYFAQSIYDLLSYPMVVAEFKSSFISFVLRYFSRVTETMLLDIFVLRQLNGVINRTREDILNKFLRVTEKSKSGENV